MSLSEGLLSIISGWVAGFHRCPINSVRQLWTQFSALWAGTGSVPGLCPWLLNAGIKEQSCGQHYLLWQRIMMPFRSRALWLLLWYLCTHLQRSTLSIACGCSLSMCQGICDVSNLVERQCFPWKRMSSWSYWESQKLSVIIHRAYSGLSAQEVAISASCSEPGARTSNVNCLRLYSCGGCARWNNLSMVAWPRRHNSLMG